MAIHPGPFAITMHDALRNAKRTIERSHRFDNETWFVNDANR